MRGHGGRRARHLARQFTLARSLWRAGQGASLNREERPNRNGEILFSVLPCCEHLVDTSQ